MVADETKTDEKKTEEKTGETGNPPTIEEQLASIEHTLTEEAALQAANDKPGAGAATTDEPANKPDPAAASGAGTCLL